jgi:hypothetical protein
MELSPFERVFLLVGFVCGAYRYVTGQWPIGVEVEEIEQ